MSSAALALVIALAVATVTFYVAGVLYGGGSAWARDVCLLSPQFCQHPSWMAFATGAMAAVYAILRICKL